MPDNNSTMLRKSQLYALLSILVLYLFFVQRVLADSPATPEPVTITYAKLLINEVNFKNTEHDWIEIYVKSGGSIKNLKLFDDSVFFEINNDIHVETGDYIIVYFKAENENIGYDGDLLVIQSDKSGLTGTTEQVALKNFENGIVDFICWRNSDPTSGEIDEFNELKIDQWIYGNIESCINSDQVSNNASIGRKNTNDTNSPDDWEILQVPTPGKTNFENETTIENSINDEELPKVVLPSVIFEFNSSETEKSNENTTEKVIESECLESKLNICVGNVVINEVLPNPDGKDTNQEWIELKNTSKESCNLEGWIVDDEDGGSKPYTLKNTDEIKGGGYLLLPSWLTKISLNNSDEKVRLYSPGNEIFDEMEFEKSIEGQSLNRLNNELVWSLRLTPMAENIILQNEEILTEEEEEQSEAEEKEVKKKSITNGDLSSQVMLNEIFPNPEGTDKGNEWIELYNDSDESVNLGNWYIDAGENSKIKYILPNNALEKHSYLLIPDSKLGFSLKNSNGEVRLLNFKEEIVDQVEYESSEENNSYSKIQIADEIAQNSEYIWEWTKEITPEEENLSKYKYKGEIVNFDSLNSKLAIKLTGNEEIFFDVLNDGASNLENILIQGAVITAISSVTDGKNILDDFEIISMPDSIKDESKTNFDFLFYLIPILLICGTTAYLIIRKHGFFKLVNA